MTKLQKLTGAIVSALLLASCGTTAKHNLQRGTPASSVRVVDVPVGAIVQAGDIAVRAEDGSAKLVLEDGWHDLYVFDGGQQIYAEKIFLQDGTQKRIDLKP